MNRKVSLSSHGLECAARTDVGLVRRNNQDALAVALAGTEKAWRERGHVLVVADGMGAHAAGELASKIAVDTVPLSYQKQRRRPPPQAIHKAMQEANIRIYWRGQANEEFRGMGTTLTTLVLLPQGGLVAHVGDSRVYRLRGDTLEQLTFDHSLVWEVCEAEGTTEAEVPAYIPRNVITRSVGSRPEVQIDMEGLFPLEAGDVFLLSSDGLSGRITNAELGTVLLSFPPEEAARALIDLAISRGGPDNITAVVARLTDLRRPYEADKEAAAGRARRRALRFLLWVIPAAVVLAVVGGIGFGWPGAALAGLVGAALGAVAGLVERQVTTPWDLRLGRLGNGPYRSCHCLLSDESAAVFAKTFDQLRGVAQGEEWQVDLDQFNAFGRRAAEATEAGDYARAVREYCGAVSFLVDYVRSQREKMDLEDELAAE